MPSYITKQDFIRFTRCPKAFQFATSGPMPRNNVSDLNLFLAKQGREVGELGRELFSTNNSVLISSSSLASAAEESSISLRQGKTIFEGVFIYENYITRPDVYCPADSVLTEFKAVNAIDNEHLLDVAFQAFILWQNGIPLKKIQIGHLNRNYVYKKNLSLGELFTFINVTKEVEQLQSQVQKTLNQMQKDRSFSDVKIGKPCEQNGGCPYKDLCWVNLSKDSVLDLRRDINGKKFELHSTGIKKLKDIPEYVSLTKHQLMQRQAEIQDAPVIDESFIKRTLGELEFPLYFLDFETIAYGIPRFENTSPYQQIPFQASIHEWRTKNSKLKHHSFLHEDATDPRPRLIEFLLAHLGDVGSIITYHASFEIGRLYDLVKEFPAHEDKLIKLIQRCWDLEPIFEKGYVHKDFKGSTSIKKVLPILCPELSYQDLKIQSGGTASVMFDKIRDPLISDESKKQIQCDLKFYCERDTFAMHALLRKMMKLK
jgi:hypothetical protein